MPWATFPPRGKPGPRQVREHGSGPWEKCHERALNGQGSPGAGG